MNGACNYKLFLAPPPVTVGRGQKVIFNFNFSPFQRFYTKLCVFSQMKDTKHIRQDFHSVARVMPQGRDFGRRGAQMVNFFSNLVTWHIKSTRMTSRT